MSQIRTYHSGVVTSPTALRLENVQRRHELVVGTFFFKNILLDRESPKNVIASEEQNNNLFSAFSPSQSFVKESFKKFYHVKVLIRVKNFVS